MGQVTSNARREGRLLIEHIPSVHHDALQNHHLLLGGPSKSVLVPVVGIFANKF